VDSAFIKGIAKVGERLVILLDLGKVLSTRESASLHSLQAAAALGATVSA
jgi:chemotaxis signal transduction protein